jgi:hypothetical protein
MRAEALGYLSVREENWDIALACHSDLKPFSKNLSLNPFSGQSPLLACFQKDTFLRKSPEVIPSLRSKRKLALFRPELRRSSQGQ